MTARAEAFGVVDVLREELALVELRSTGSWGAPRDMATRLLCALFGHRPALVPLSLRVICTRCPAVGEIRIKDDQAKKNDENT